MGEQQGSIMETIGRTNRSRDTSVIDSASDLEVKLVPFAVDPPARLVSSEPDAQCDCACFTVEGQVLPVLQTPISFYLELTPFCNNRCPQCGNVFMPRRGQTGRHALPQPLKASQWAEILDKIHPYAYRLKLTGGEPTIHPELEAILANVARLSLPFTLFSNGRWPAPERLLTVLKSIPNFQGFLISLHGPTPDAHEVFTQYPGSFIETLTNIQKAIQMNLPVSLSCIITHHNWRHLERMLRIAKELGATNIVFNRYLGPEVAGLSPTPQELRSAALSVQALRADGEPVKFGNCFPQCFLPTGQTGCLAGVAFLTVDPWGQVRPCNHTSWVCGNLFLQSVEEIWNSPNMNRWRSQYADQCRNCAAFSTCRGGCRAQAFLLHQVLDPLASHPLPSSKGLAVKWSVYEQARPLGRFVSRPENFGTLLLAGNRLFPVRRELQNVLTDLDGQTTMRQIQDRYGTAGLVLIASLYQQGMLELLY